MGKLSFSDSHNATLQIRVKKLFGTYNTSIVEMVILLFFRSCNFAKNLFSFVVQHTPILTLMEFLGRGLFFFKYRISQKEAFTFQVLIATLHSRPWFLPTVQQKVEKQDKSLSTKSFFLGRFLTRPSKKDQGENAFGAPYLVRQNKVSNCSSVLKL